jgi:hypothetical protein
MARNSKLCTWQGTPSYARGQEVGPINVFKSGRQECHENWMTAVEDETRHIENETRHIENETRHRPSPPAYSSGDDTFEKYLFILDVDVG